MDNVHVAFFIGDGIHVGVALDVGVAVVVQGIIQNFFPILVEGDGHGDLDGLFRHDGGRGSVVEQVLGVQGGDLAVAVDVSDLGVERIFLAELAGQVVQDGLGVGSVGLAVHVDVGLEEVGVLIDLAVDLIGGLGAEQHRAGIGQDAVAAVAGDALGEDVGAEGELLGALQGVDREGVGVNTGALGIIAEFRLDLAVTSGVGEEGGVLIHQDVGLGGGRVGDIRKAGAHADDCPVIAVGVIDGMRGGHQQGVDQLTLGQAGLLAQAVVTDVLAHHGRHTGNLRRRHGGTGHDLVVLMGVRGGAGTDVGAPDGIDGSAGSQDLGLQDQRARHAVGGEGGHIHGIGDLGNLNLHLRSDAHGTLVVQDVAFLIGNGLGVCLDGVAVGLQDGNGRSAVVVAGQVHVDDAGLVIDDDNRDSALGHGGVGLREEGGGAAVAHGDLAGDDVGAEGGEVVAFLADVLVVVNADVVEQDVLVLVAGDRGDRAVAVAGGLAVEHVHVAEEQRHTGLAAVVHGGYGERVGEGAGAAAGGVVGIVDVEVGVLHGRVVGSVVPHTAVAGGEGNDKAVLDELVHDGLIAAGEAEAGGAGAEGQVRGVAAQNDGVLDGDHVVGIVSAAALAEDLHDNQLCVGSDALGADGLEGRLELVADLDKAVGRRDAGNVGAVLALGIVHVHDVADVLVNVVVTVADLGVAVGRSAGADVGVQLTLDSLDGFRGQQVEGRNVVVIGHALFRGGLSKSVLKAFGGEGLVLNVGTGVDDSDLAAGAGVAIGPRDVGADHVGGGAVFGLVNLLINLGLVAVFQENCAHAVDSLDGVDLTVEDVRGDEVGGKGQIPHDVQLPADRLFDPGGHSSLVGAEFVAIGHSGRVFRDTVGAELVQGSGLVQGDGDTDHVSHRVFFLVDGGVLRDEIRLLSFQCTGVDRGQLEFDLGLGRLSGLRAGHRDQERSEHGNDQSHRQNPTVQRCVLHSHFSL